MNEENKDAELNEELEECKKKRDEYFAGWQREKADFINYKKRELERLEEVLFSAKESILLEMLPVIDNFSLAEKNISEEEKGDKNIKGLLLIGKQLLSAMKSLGIEGIECIGKKFDPTMHEAVGEKEHETIEPGTVIEEVEKGYRIGERIIRPSKVKISK